MVELPSEFVQRTIRLHGARGHEWLAALPALVGHLQDLWELAIEAPVHPLSYHYVAFARQAPDREVVLKLGFPSSDFTRETHCLAEFGGRGAVQLLQVDAPLGAMLLERIRPGTDIRDMHDSDAIPATADVMERLHHPFPTAAAFPSVDDWALGFQRHRSRHGGSTGPIDEVLFEDAEATYLDLAKSMGPPLLLHGDLHHQNVLASNRAGWLAIDPQGVIGEAAYEVGAFLRNPMPDLARRPDLSGIMSRRVLMLADRLALDAARVRGWGFSQAVLSAIWSIEDLGSGFEPQLVVAEAIRRSA